MSPTDIAAASDAATARPAPAAGHSQYRLLGERRFAPFFWTQFLGAANDNVFKISFTGLVTYQSALFPGVNADQVAFLISAIFIAPYVLFSATSGQIADKWEKSRLIRLVKTLEIGIMIIGGLGFLTHHIYLLYACTFLMGLHSTLFGPVKYAYLPQHLAQTELVGGNGLVEMGTFVAILLGTILGGELAGMPVGAPHWAALACVTIALAGRLVSIGVPASPASAPALRINWNPFSETWRNLKLAHQSRTVFLSLLGISWLWFFGATFLTSFFPFAKNVLGGDAQVVTLLLAVFSIGIGLGSLLCERLSGPRLEIGLVPFGSIGMSVFAIDLYFTSAHLTAGPALVGVGAFLAVVRHWHVLADLFLLSLFGGFYSVPLYALIQSRSEPTHRARIIAANNILNALFMIVSSLLGIFLLGTLHFSIPELFLTTAVLNAAVAVYIYGLVPEFLMRFLAWLLIHSVYRVRSIHTERIPESGAALLACNHVSFVDAVVVMAQSPRPIRFVMDHQIFRLPVLAFIFRTARAIPIASASEHPDVFEAANTAIDEALAAGDLVCIFPEGRITKTGEMNPFRSGIIHVARRNGVEIYPMALRGLWGSFFSRFSGRAFSSIPRPLRRGMSSRLEVIVGEPLAPGAATTEALAAAVEALHGAPI